MNFMVVLVIGGCQANHYNPEDGCKACPSGRINPANAEDTWYAFQCRCNIGFESTKDGYQGAPDYPCNQCKKGTYQNEETIAKNSCKEPIGCLPNKEKTACTLCPGGGVPDPDPDNILSAQYGCINIQCSSGSGVVSVNSQGGCEDGMYKCDDKCAVSFEFAYSTLQRVKYLILFFSSFFSLFFSVPQIFFILFSPCYRNAHEASS